MYKCSKKITPQTELVGTLDNAWSTVSVPTGENVCSYLYNEDFYKSGGLIMDEKLTDKCKLIMTDPDYMHTLFDNTKAFYRNCWSLLRDDGFLALIIDVRSRDDKVNKSGYIHIPHLLNTLMGIDMDDINRYDDFYSVEYDSYINLFGI